MAEVWPRYGRSVAEVWPKYGRGAAEVWPRCGRGVAETSSGACSVSREAKDHASVATDWASYLFSHTSLIPHLAG